MGNFSQEQAKQLQTLWQQRLSLGGDGGLPGPTGPQGPAGPAGPQGAAGAPGAGLTRYVSTVTELEDALVELNDLGTGGDIHMAGGFYHGSFNVYGDGVNIYAEGNTVIRPPAGQDGIVFDRVTGGSIQGVTVQHVANPGAGESVGIMVRGGSGVTVQNNRIYDADDAGISIQYDKYRFYQLSEADRKDLDLTYDIDGTGHIVVNNYVEATAEGCGIEMSRCNDTIVANNHIKDPTQHGIRVLGVHGCVVADNIVIDPGATYPWGGISIQAFGDAAEIGGISKYTTVTVIDGNRVRSSGYPMSIFNGCEDVVISNNVLENPTTTNNCIANWTIENHYHSPAIDYDLKNVTISGNLLKGSRTSLLLMGDTEDVHITGNRFVDFDYIGVSLDGNTPQTFGTPLATTLERVYIKDNAFIPSADGTQDPKYGIYCLATGTGSADGFIFGNDHAPTAGYTYNETAEVTNGTLTELFYNDAPSDGSEYVRKNAAWFVATGGGGGGDALGNIDCGDADTDNSDGYIDFGEVT